MLQPELRPTLSVSTMSRNDEQWSYNVEEVMTSQGVLGQCEIKSQHAEGTFKTVYALFIYVSKDWVRSLGRWATAPTLTISIIKSCPLSWNPENHSPVWQILHSPFSALNYGCMQSVDSFP